MSAALRAVFVKNLQDPTPFLDCRAHATRHARLCKGGLAGNLQSPMSCRKDCVLSVQLPTFQRPKAPRPASSSGPW